MQGNSYYYRKLHSLLGVVPLGIYLVFHLFTNYSAYHAGAAAFAEKVAWINSQPFVALMEIFFIALPILFHGVYGLYIAFQSRNNVTRYGYFRNQMFFWQRLTGVITLIFIIWHVYETRIQVLIGAISHDQLGAQMNDILTSPIGFTIYVIGVLAAVFHFCNGMWSFMVSWGITITPKSQQVSTVFWMVMFILISAMGIFAMIGFLNPEFQG